MAFATRDEIIQGIIPDVDYHQNHYARCLDQLVPNGCRWLDLGAGTQVHHGFRVPTSASLAARAASLVGIDPVTTHLSENSLLHFGVGGVGNALPFRDGSFDVVTANMVVEHLADPLSVFGEIRRVLSEGGRFIFVTPNLNHPIVRGAHVLLSQSMRQALAVRLEGREEEHVFLTHYRANTVRSVRRFAKQAGFSKAQVTVYRNIPMIHRPRAAVVLECLFIKVTGFRPLRWMGGNIVAVLEH